MTGSTLRITLSAICLMVLMCSLARAQTHKREIMTNAGAEYSSPSVSVNWTIGEPVIKTISNRTHFITQGFNQTYWELVGEWELPPLDLEVGLFPNPMASDIRVHFKDISELNENFRFIVYDMLYKPVFEQELFSVETQFDLGFLRNGTYIMHVVNERGDFLKTFKVVKNE